MVDIKQASGVSVNDLRGIKTGESVVFVVDHPRKIHSIASMAYHLNKVEPESGRKYSCRKDEKWRRITVTANPL